VESAQFSLYSLLIVTSLAVVVPMVVSRIKSFRIPIVVGEILVGAIVGHSGFNIIQNSEWLDFLQFFGLAYLMFVSGLEIDFHALKPSVTEGTSAWRKWLISAPSFAIVSCAITFGLSFTLTVWLYHHHFIESPLLVALIITTTSLTVVVPVLKEYNVLQSKFGQLILAAAVFADFVTMLLISVAASLFKGGLTANTLLVFVLFTVLLVVYFVARHFSGFSVFRGLAHGTAQLGIRASLALMVVFIVLSQTLGVQVILGTFLAGILVGLLNQRERTDIYGKLDAIGFGFLIPIFFIMVGVNFDIKSLFGDKEALILLPVLLIATYLFKGLPALLLRFVYPWRRTAAAAVILTTQMSVTVAAAAVGLRIGAITPGMNTAIILVAMVTSVVSPVLFGKIVPHAEEAAPEKIVIFGSSPEAKLLLDRVRSRGEEIEWIRPRVKLSEQAFENMKNGIVDPSVTLEKLDIPQSGVRAILLYTFSDTWNLALAKEAVTMGIPLIICSVRDVELLNQHKNETRFRIVNPQISVVSFVDQLLHYPASSELLRHVDTDLEIQEVRLTNLSLVGKQLMDMALPPSLLIFSIVRSGMQIVPHGQTRFQYGDTLVVVGNDDDVNQFTRLVKAHWLY
jgi:monovalent cation:H+ antiporter-2, CPA2 family